MKTFYGKRLFDFQSLEQAKSLLIYFIQSESTYYRQRLKTMPKQELYYEFTESGISYYGWEVIFLAELESRATVYLNRIETLEGQLRQDNEAELYKEKLLMDLCQRNKKEPWHGKFDNLGRRIIIYNYESRGAIKLPKFNFTQRGEDFWGGSKGWAWAFFIAPYYHRLVYPIFVKSLDILVDAGAIFYKKEIKTSKNNLVRETFKVVKCRAI